MTGAGRLPAVRDTALAAAIRAAHWIVTLLYAGIGYLGIIVLGSSAVVAVVGMGVVVPVLVAGVLVHRGERCVPTRRLVHAAMVGAGVIPFGAGVNGLGTGAAAPVAVMFGCGLVLVFGQGFPEQRLPERTATPHRRPGREGLPDDLPGGLLTVDSPNAIRSEPDPVLSMQTAHDEQVLRAALQAASLRALFRQWRTTSRELAGHRPGRDGGHRLAAMRLRELLLEEMERRDPDGVRRWLVEGPADAPHRYVQGDRDVGV